MRATIFTTNVNESTLMLDVIADQGRTYYEVHEQEEGHKAHMHMRTDSLTEALHQCAELVDDKDV